MIISPHHPNYMVTLLLHT